MPPDTVLIAIVAGITGTITTIISKVKCYFNINPCVCQYQYIEQHEVIQAVEPSIDTQKEVICL